MKNKEIKNNLFHLLVSMVTFCVNIFLIYPFAEINHAFSSGGTMDMKARIILILVTLPMLIMYFLYLSRIYKSLKYFNFLNYPLNVLNLSLSFTFAFVSITGYGLFLFFIILPWIGAVICSLVGMCYGLIQDIKSWKEYVNNRKK